MKPAVIHYSAAVVSLTSAAFSLWSFVLGASDLKYYELAIKQAGANVFYAKVIEQDFRQRFIHPPFKNFNTFIRYSKQAVESLVRKLFCLS